MAVVFGPATNPAESNHAYWVALDTETGALSVRDSSLNFNGYPTQTTSFGNEVSVTWGSVTPANTIERFISAGGQGFREAETATVRAIENPVQTAQAIETAVSPYLTWSGPGKLASDIYHGSVNYVEGAVHAYNNGSLPEYLGHTSGTAGTP